MSLESNALAIHRVPGFHGIHGQKRKIGIRDLDDTGQLCRSHQCQHSCSHGKWTGVVDIIEIGTGSVRNLSDLGQFHFFRVQQELYLRKQLVRPGLEHIWNAAPIKGRPGVNPPILHSAKDLLWIDSSPLTSTFSCCGCWSQMKILRES